MLKIKLNEDKEIVDTIKQELKENNGYCPCKIIKNEDTKCMCKEFREQLTELNFFLGNAIKYITRAGKKNKDTYIEDLEKAVNYLNKEIELYKKGVSNN